MAALSQFWLRKWIARNAPKDLFVLLVILVSVFFCVAGLASQSLSPVFFGKSNFLWAIIVLSGGFAAGLGLVTGRFPKTIRLFKRVLILSIITLVLLEASGWIFPSVWPVEVLVRMPNWARAALPDSAFERTGFRQLRVLPVDDSELGYLMKPNADVHVIESGLDYFGTTDGHGFNNVDDTLYFDADIVVIGDSFTQGWGVPFDDSWAQQLSQNSGQRVLNLGTSSWDVYQFPRALERFVPDAAPEVLVVALLSWNDLKDTYYDYADFREVHPDIEGVISWQNGQTRWEALKRDKKNYISFFYEVASYAAPFTTSTIRYIQNPNISRDFPSCDFSIDGKKISHQFTVLNQYGGDAKIPYLDRVREDLLRIVDLADRVDSELYFMYIPYPEEVYIPLLESATDLNDCATSVLANYQAGSFNFDKHLNQYKEALGRHADLLINATPFLQEAAAQGEQQNWPFDPHPTSRGHERLGEFIAQSIQE